MRLNSRKVLDVSGIEEASLTQYVRRDWSEKLLFIKNAKRSWYKKPFNLMLGGAGITKLSTENGRGGWY